jgi:hypothetical protein
MKFSDVIDQASALLQRKHRLTYRSLKLEFDLNDEQLDVLKEELIDGQQVAKDEAGKVLVWIGASPVQSSTFQVQSSPPSPTPQTPNAELRTSQPLTPNRQLPTRRCISPSGFGRQP